MRRGNLDELEYEYAKKEDEFVVVQGINKAIKRIKNDRASCIDHLVLNMPIKRYFEELDESDRAMVLEYPIKNPADLANKEESLLQEVRQKAEESIHEKKYWKALEVLCRELPESKELEMVNNEVSNIISKLKPDELMELKKVSANQTGTQAYWQAIATLADQEVARRDVLAIHKNVILERKILRATRSSESRSKVTTSNSHETPVSNEVKEDLNTKEYVTPDGGIENEDQFDDRVHVDSTGIEPKYFNKVILGYTWNRYNRTHYSEDKPPPKVPRGYRFKLYYPDLSPGTIPKYDVKRNDDTTSIIVFHAGPPYKDVAFRIATGPWNRTTKNTSHPFVSSFKDGILELSFDFKR
ncbi:hypothetical protein CANCADRAFT_3770 [Tortispora caseinolytica NRRL Y-17796]|uniref:Splicing factor Cactin n=1 Tax=Tortispora caseinolytica NRRL Y-17796 TaxID=767744 RepID=A0A1E4TBJ5_9ASCO|nr:hypothetical protein CANCADRAFT_3770 [Tortispora caseinolytica NRRL Y-17796]